MPRMSQQDALAAVAEILNAASDGVLTHQELVEALENQGRAQAVPMLHRLSKTGDITAKVVTRPDTKPELQYSLPAPPAAAPTVPSQTAPPPAGA